MRKLFPCFLFALLLSLAPAQIGISLDDVVDSKSEESLTLIVMDPLCDKLACDCVQGYAQRKYEVLGEYLQDQLGREVDVLWGESISNALEETNAKPDIVIGKYSVIQGDAKSGGFQLNPVASLTGTDGSVWQTGLIVVRKNDPALQVSDLGGYRIFFGPKDCDEKSAAPMKLLQENGIALPDKPEVSGACSEAATKLMELSEEIKAAAVISSYAEPLLSGCGTIEKGDLRVIGISEEVPFVAAFVNTRLSQSTQSAIRSALLAAGKKPGLRKALETKSGFVPFKSSAVEKRSPSSKEPAESGSADGRSDSKKK